MQVKTETRILFCDEEREQADDAIRLLQNVLELDVFDKLPFTKSNIENTIKVLKGEIIY